MAKTTKSDSGRLIRLSEVLERLPLSKSKWWHGISTGKFPQPVKLGPRLTCWREKDIDDLVERGLQ